MSVGFNFLVPCSYQVPNFCIAPYGLSDSVSAPVKNRAMVALVILVSQFQYAILRLVRKMFP